MATPSETSKRRVLFVCIGNSCRSQMAEGFARTYGADVMESVSAGTHPASIVQPLTKQVMLEKNISLDGQYPKPYGNLPLSTFDIIVNMSGLKLSVPPSCEVREWTVIDPIGQPEEVYVAVRDEIEYLVMRLILELRGRRIPQKKAPQEPAGAHSSAVYRMGRRR